ncbi:hypothetical protein ASE37_13465 [Rhizobium sp. Root268]|nr:hypothetical protein ASC86_13470 [Rhizobium sp. Root1212]KRD25012.1 hypothetical protein ASE37_13465 [Rhizobium sp. Root268]
MRGKTFILECAVALPLIRPIGHLLPACGEKGYAAPSASYFLETLDKTAPARYCQSLVSTVLESLIP